MSELGLNEVRFLAQKFSRLSKLQTTCLEEVLIAFFCVDWVFLFSSFFVILSEILFHFRTRKLRRVVKHAHYASGGAFQGIIFSKEIVSEKNGRNIRKTADIVQKTSSLLSKLLSTFPTEISSKRYSYSNCSRILS